MNAGSKASDRRAVVDRVLQERGRTMSKASRPEPVCLVGNTQKFWVAEQNHGRELGWEMTLKIKEELKEWQRAYTLFLEENEL